MKKQEKTQKTKERIIAAALKEFGSKSYYRASVNGICEVGKISKGLIYHNFKGKDELYLLCVKACYDELTATLKAQPFEIKSAKDGLQNFLLIRQKFFQDNPQYANIFFNAVLQPPKHLTHELAQLRSGFDEYFSKYYLALLDFLTLRDGITKEMALEYFLGVSEMFNSYFQKKSEQNGDYRELINDHEGRLSAIFDIILYGVAKEPKEKNPKDKKLKSE
ncbi:MAG: TetR/AcrR family transcriptional regulator [Peptoniphilus sp.]|uniref:TetR/AcrR family transcriptional regulator n=1 Tax=Peptoniphilus sp. TaxID=1971214 RepID=UPI0025CC2E3C|nr:TetR/AcrR family transcriptional regulator [Peptoniphilus sp.]MCI5642702.1 TetR/AcrR family transcriptional regulator [Peptoniphilus sp.]MDD7353473.1 TetR/AcrR family transcriptional regulator [Peptoniphilaceae bacterium]